MALPYDVITVGGGLAGSALAKCLAERAVHNQEGARADPCVVRAANC
jgi:flavin-dependent dehydrogenase